MRTGIVLDMDETSLTLLTPDGEFVRADRKKRIYSIGEEISFDPVGGMERRKKFAFGKLTGMKRAWMAAAAVFLLMASALIPLQSTDKVYAYMSIDVNPSIELALNDGMQVVKMNAYNPEGNKIVSSLKHWEKEPVSNVAEQILSEINRQGYFAKTNDVIISAVNANKVKPEAEEKLKETMKAITEKAAQGQHRVKVYNGSQKDLKEARKLGLTTGKYKAEGHTGKQAAENGGKNVGAGKGTEQTPAAATGNKPGQEVNENKKKLPPGLEKKDEIPGKHEEKAEDLEKKNNNKPNGNQGNGQNKNKGKELNNHSKNNNHINNNKNDNKANNENGKKKGHMNEVGNSDKNMNGKENKNNKSDNGKDRKGQNQGNQNKQNKGKQNGKSGK
ncbi:anti-sigma factor domain-containing protein [Bacillus sp. B-jedd]|uniref:anti-sigma factor domain-containing protein n=1 Tax=Bacillus sp. B-jedd TaxID=1476857 RepID=UPI0005155795|nr:anti-sigma factor domain-containing protein [Bacillus sp. B-jedd]CEG26590.1 sigmaI modulating factor [Bacillus sp. B-jedd]